MKIFFTFHKSNTIGKFNQLDKKMGFSDKIILKECTRGKRISFYSSETLHGYYPLDSERQCSQEILRKILSFDPYLNMSLHLQNYTAKVFNDNFKF